MGFEVEGVKVENFERFDVTGERNRTDSVQSKKVSTYWRKFTCEYSFQYLRFLSVVVLQTNRRPDRTSYRLLKP